ncbi:MAG: ABC transporter ATP-binding protein [Clostridia bacterium]|nr:ABC transporter ATP-binding protein [Clostridia bacterium]
MRIEHIKKSYSGKTVLKDVSFEASKGQCIGILGGNGSGKSTLLSILAGVQKSDKGNFFLNGYDFKNSSKKLLSQVGYVPQNTPLLEELSAFDNLRLWYDESSLEKSLHSGVLAMLGVGDFLKVPVHKMSGGMKKRLAIGCAVGHNPEVLLLDEPSAALDLLCKERISNYLLDFKSRGGIIVLATHDVQELPLCDKLYILKDGYLEPYVFDGNVHRLAGKL